MQIATLGIVLENGRMLLGEKKKGEIGIGVLSGPGGKLEKGEALKKCLIRETYEELGLDLDPTSLELVAKIIFHKGRTCFVFLNQFLNIFKLGCVADFEVYVYRTCLLPRQKIYKETEDMTPRWYPLDEIPYERMYEADRYWMPIVVAGHKIRANVYYLGRAEKFDHIEIFPFKMS